MDDIGTDTRVLAERANALRAAGKTAMFVAADGRLAGLVAVADPNTVSEAQLLASA